MDKLDIGDSILVNINGNQTWMNITFIDNSDIFGYDIDNIDNEEIICIKRDQIIDVFNEEKANEKYKDILKAMMSEEIKSRMQSARCSESGFVSKDLMRDTRDMRDSLKERESSESNILKERESFCGVWAKKLEIMFGTL